MVTVVGHFVVQSVSSPTGLLSIDNLPFAPVVWIFFACAPLAVMASFLASRRILKSDLSESLREGAG